MPSYARRSLWTPKAVATGPATYVQSVSATAALNANLVLTLGSAPTSGHLGVIFAATDTVGNVPTPSGWTQIFSGNSSCAGCCGLGNNNVILVKSLAGTETTVTVPGVTGGHLIGSYFEISGQSVTPVAGDVILNVQSQGGAVTSPRTTSATATSRLVLSSLISNAVTTPNTYTLSSVSNTSSLTQRESRASATQTIKSHTMVTTGTPLTLTFTSTGGVVVTGDELLVLQVR